MSEKFKWYSGGEERREKALMLITELLVSLSDNSKNSPLQKVLLAYKNEVEIKSSAIPFILSRLNIAVAKTIIENEITLSPEQSEILKELSSLSNIRYGY